MNESIRLTSANFDEVVISSPVPVLVDVWAPWCGPCKLIAPVIDEIAREGGGRYRVSKLNIDEEPEMAQRFRIRGVPTLLYFRNGELHHQDLGITPKKDIAHHLRELANPADYGGR